ncbi:uncharacterized protein LOC143294196 [Babylonia areolata]|uniref:uncharacterized protein LOC143294196 n=1 Tax=Babylonia areolata TaxID=304850 RepID=UPI003FD663FD
MKGKVQREQRHAYWTYINNIIDPPKSDDEQLKGSNQKRFWNYIKSLRRDSTGVSPLRDQGRLFASPKEKANILNHQYKSVFTREKSSKILTPSGVSYPAMAEITIDKEGVRKLLKNINPYKAAGPDEIPAKVLKECADEIAPLLSIIFTKSLADGCVPDDWKMANVTAVF